jgi:hypothetical protein
MLFNIWLYQKIKLESICSDDKELKKQLLRKYSGCLGNLRKELSKKRKKGKLPKEARQKLLSWWELHYRWPYPSVRIRNYTGTHIL